MAPTNSDVDMHPQFAHDLNVVRDIGLRLEAEFGQTGSARFIKRLMQDVLAGAVAHTISHGYYRLPSSLGCLRLSRCIRSRPTKGPDGETVWKRFPHMKVEFQNGSALREALGQMPLRRKFRRNRTVTLPPILQRVLVDGRGAPTEE